MNAPGRISVFAPIHVGPMIVAYAGNFTLGGSQTQPSICTPAGIVRAAGASLIDASAAPICFSHSHGAASAGKCGVNRASEGGSVNNSEAFIGSTHQRWGRPGRGSIVWTSRWHRRFEGVIGR